MRLELVSYTKKDDFTVCLTPCLYFMGEDKENGLARVLGFMWLCWSIEIIW